MIRETNHGYLPILGRVVFMRCLGAIAIAVTVTSVMAAKLSAPVLPFSEVKSEFSKRMSCKFGQPVIMKTSGDYDGAPNLVTQRIYPCGNEKRVLIEYYTVPFWFWEEESYLRSKIEFHRTVNNLSDSFDVWFQRGGSIERIVWYPHAQRSRESERYELIRDQRLAYSGDGKLHVWEVTIIKADHEKKSATYTTRRYDPVSGKPLSEQHGDWDYDEFVCPEDKPHCQN